jgi:hypothetical protein
MTGIEIALVLDGAVKVGSLAFLRNRVLNRKVMFYHKPEDKKSILDGLVLKQNRRALTKQDCLRVKFADGITILIRKVVVYDAFRQLMRALALPNSPLRRRLRGQRRLS